MRDPVLANTPITVTEVRISSDLRHATVFVMPLGGKEETAVVGALGRASGYLRRQIAHAVHLKFVPDMTFRIDRSFEQADRITRILNEPAVSRDLDQTRRRDADDLGEE